MKLIIAEKPDVARKFRDALTTDSKAIKHSEMVYYYQNKSFIFASAKGHLFKAKSPQEIDEENKIWSLSPLKLPKVLPLKISDSASAAYFACIKELVSRPDVDEIIVATDPDREGQLIWALIARNLKITKPVTRVLIKEWPKAGLIKAFNERKPNSEQKNLELAGLCRLQADYYIGLNATMGATVAFGGYGNVINNGRVQTPTRYLVYQNDKAIKEFVPQKYNILSITTASDEKNKTISLNGPKLQPNVAQQILPRLKNRQYKLNKETKQTSKNCPKLYTTSDIQIDASEKFGLSVDETTSILQKLYQDYALTTYPRTDINLISESSAKNVMQIVNSLDGAGLIDDIITEIKSKHLSFQKHLIDAKGGEMPHEAITPTYDGTPKAVLNKLTQNELNIYTLIVKRFLQGFYSPAIIDETSITTSVQFDSKDYTFRASGKIVSDPSWMKISGIPSASFLPMITDGKTYDCLDAKAIDKMTNPPARLTEATLLKIMDSPTKLVKDKNAQKVLKRVKGIGTEATRNDIIKSLFANNFLVKKGKSIYPTEKTIQSIEVLPNSPLTSPMMTAELETKLSEVEHGKRSFDDFMSEVNKQVDEILESIRKAPKRTIAGGKDTVGKCPKCGSSVSAFKMGYSCDNKDCNFVIWDTVASKKITIKAVKQLLENKRTDKIKGFKSKTGKSFDAYLILDENNKVAFDFNEVKKESTLKCPYCGGKMNDYESRISCENNDFVIWKTVAGKKLTQTAIKQLCEKGATTQITGFKSKAGKSFSAKLKRNDSTKKIEFDFS